MKDFLTDRSREFLEAQALPKFLPLQRWFGGKARAIEKVTIADWSVPAEDGLAAAWLVLEVQYAGGEPDLYSLPLALAAGATANGLEETKPELVLCRVTFRGEPAILFDATADEPFALAILKIVEEGRELATARGVLRAFTTSVFQEIRGPHTVSLPATRGTAEQSNTSIIYGDRLILKVFRRLEPGVNPDVEVGRFLTEVAGFTRIPQLAGAIEYVLPDGSLMTLGLLQALVPNQGDAWRRFSEDLLLFYEERAARGTPPPEGLHEGSFLEASRGEVPASVCELIGSHLDAARSLGQRTAELHSALATETNDPAFRSEPLSADDLRQISARLRDEITQALSDLQDSLSRLPEELVEEAGLVLAQRSTLLSRARLLEVADVQSRKIRIHGDYHLGQVLCVQNDYVLFDFEGEPARSVAERRAKYPALKDVAGMLRSFSNAASGSLLNYATRRPDDVEQLRAWASFWEKWVSALFLKGYQDSLSAPGLVPSQEPAFRDLLEIYLLEKALYELRYELNNRPAWVRIPLGGILALLRKG